MLENKTKSWFRKSDALLAAFLVPVFVLLIIYAQRGIYPFGDRIYLRMDMYHQYAPFMSEFRNKLVGGGSLLYSWDIGMGVNFVPIYAYYLASPLNWLLAFVPRGYILEFMDYGIILKTGLAGLTMAFYLQKHSENSNFAPALFGIFYALSGYMAAYSWNIMWLDCIVLFPLVCLGIEKIVNEKRGFLYAVTLGICIVSNYYISIMICIFAVIYYILIQIMKGKQSFGSFAGSTGIFAAFSLLAGGVAAILWLPQIYEYTMTASADSDIPNTVYSYFSMIDVFARHLVNVGTETELEHWPNIYCGVAVIPLSVLFAANRKISVKEKCLYFLTAFFMAASFSLNILAFFWHGFHYPNSLPSRQSFIYIFLILYMGFRAVDQLEGNKLKDIGIALIVSAAFILFAQKFNDTDYYEWSVWYVSLGFIAVYSLLLYLYRSGKLNVNAATFIVLAVVSIEAAVNMTTTGISCTSRNQYLSDNENTRAVVRYVEDDKDFYRFEKTPGKSKDDGAWMNFHSVSLFASTAHADMSKLFAELGCESSVNAYSIVGSTPLVDALFDIKYSVHTGASDDPYQKLLCRSGDMQLYRNEYCMPLGYMLPKDIDKKWIMDMGSPVLVQNQLCKVLGTQDVLKQVDGFKEGGIYSFTVPDDGLYYAFSENKGTDEIEVRRGDESKKYENMKRGYFIELGWLKKNEIIDFVSADKTELMVHAYRFNYEALAEITEKLSPGKVTVTGYDDTHVYADIDVPDGEDGMLMMTVPYDSGWKVNVDGQPTETYKALNAFIGFDLKAGKHKITMEFYPCGLQNGMYASCTCIGILIIIAIVTLIVGIVRKKKRDDTEQEQEVLKLPEPIIQTVKASDNEIKDEEEKEEPEQQEPFESDDDKPGNQETGKSVTEKPEDESYEADEEPEETEEKLMPKGVSHARQRSRSKG